MLVDIPSNVLAAMQSSNNLVIKTFVDQQVQLYSPKNIITESLVPLDATGIEITISKVAASPLSVQVDVVLTGVVNSTIKADSENDVKDAILSGFSALRAWSNDMMRPDEVVNLFNSAMLTRIKDNNISVTFNSESIDPFISFGTV